MSAGACVCQAKVGDYRINIDCPVHGMLAVARPRWEVIHGDCLDLLPTIPANAVIVSDPPYGMAWNTDSTRFSGGDSEGSRYRGQGRDNWGEVSGDATPFDPSPWLVFDRVTLWGANHYAQRLPVGTTLVWLKRNDTGFGTFLSDAEVGWQKGGYGVYCHRRLFPGPSRKIEGDGAVAHPTQKPVSLMRWCISRLKLAPGTLIVDPYCGSGTTGVAAMLEGMRFLGIEIEERYAETARRRIAAAAAQTSLDLEAA